MFSQTFLNSSRSYVSSLGRSRVALRNNFAICLWCSDGLSLVAALRLLANCAPLLSGQNFSKITHCLF